MSRNDMPRGRWEEFSEVRSVFLSKVGFRAITRVQIEELLASAPHLQHLELEMSIDIDLINGKQWEILLNRHLTNLVRLDFKFDLEQTNFNRIPTNTFRSTFWLSEKGWIAVFDPINFGFNTVPLFARKRIGFPNNHDRSADGQSLPFDHYVTCLHLSSMSDKQSFEKYHCMHVREIILSSPINDDWIERLGSIFCFDQVEELNIGRNQLLQVLIQIKPVMPQLQRLLPSSRSLNTLGKHNAKGLMFGQIRALQFYDTDCPVDEYESLCCLFPNLEHLKIGLKNRFDILPYLEQLKHLCVAACELKRA